MSGSLSSLGRVLQVASIGASFGILAMLAAPAQADPGPGCVSVAVPEPLELPDGSVYPAGNLSLCIGPTSGVTTHQRVSIGGVPVGILMSHRGESVASATGEPSMLFRRVPSGHLQLIGYAWPSATGNRTYALSDPAEHLRKPRFDVSIAPVVAERVVETPAPVLVSQLN